MVYPNRIARITLSREPALGALGVEPVEDAEEGLPLGPHLLHERTPVRPHLRNELLGTGAYLLDPDAYLLSPFAALLGPPVEARDHRVRRLLVPQQQLPHELAVLGLHAQDNSCMAPLRPREPDLTRAGSAPPGISPTAPRPPLPRPARTTAAAPCTPRRARNTRCGRSG